MSGYGVFAKYYDALTKNINYAERARYFDALLRRYAASPPKLMLDLACGTGSLSIELQRLDYEIIGTDASAEMLSVASTKAYELDLGSRPVFLNQEMEKLDLYGTVDAAICALDSVNHIPSEKNLLEVFKKVSLFMNPGGVFIFDANTLHKHRYVLAGNVFVYDLPEVFCVWQNAYDKSDNSINIALDFFEKTSGTSYTRLNESFSEYYYAEETFVRLLSESGFEHLATLEDESLDSGGKPQRLVYVAKKND